VLRARLKSKPEFLFGPLRTLSSEARILAVLLLAIFLATGIPLKAQSNHVEELLKQLIFTPASPRPSNWTITILTQPQWDQQVKTLNLRTATAFTVMNENSETFLNPDYVFNSRDIRLLHTLAHEAGHLICRCSDERSAEDVARMLEGRL
jgi:hypothetical protein